MAVLAPLIARAQPVVDPTTAEFDPSADHDAFDNGIPIVSSYKLMFYLLGASQPFQEVSLGKSSPGPDGKIRVVFTGLMGAVPTPGISYEARVAAVGPGGEGTSAPSNQFTFSVPLPCSYSATPPTQTVAAGAGNGSVSVTTTGSCGWSATSNETWITIMSGGSGSGNGTVNFSVTANTGTSPRNGSLTVAGQTVSVTQCGFNVAPTSQTMPAAAGNNSVSVTTAAACSWGATSSAAWITITNAGPGAGNGSVSYSVTANPTTSQRSGTLTVAGRTVAINQTGMCAFALSGTNQNVPAAGGSSSVTVTTNAGCGWTASSNATWITITSGTPGSGTAPLNFSVTANTTSTPRTGTLTVAGQPLTLTQPSTNQPPSAPTGLVIR